MRLIRLASLIGHLFLAPNWQYNCFNTVVSNTWVLNCCLDDIWVSHLTKINYIHHPS